MQRTAIAILLMYAAGSAQGQSSNRTRPGSAGRLGYRVNSIAFPAEVGVARQGILQSYARAGALGVRGTSRVFIGCTHFDGTECGARILGLVHSGRYQMACHRTGVGSDRREEIALRIGEAWKPKDFHLPNDLKDPDAGG